MVSVRSGRRINWGRATNPVAAKSLTVCLGGPGATVFEHDPDIHPNCSARQGLTLCRANFRAEGFLNVGQFGSLE